MIVADSTNKENVFSVEKGRKGEGNVIITDVIYVKIITDVIYVKIITDVIYVKIITYVIYLCEI